MSQFEALVKMAKKASGVLSEARSKLEDLHDDVEVFIEETSDDLSTVSVVTGEVVECWFDTDQGRQWVELEEYLDSAISAIEDAESKADDIAEEGAPEDE